MLNEALKQAHSTNSHSSASSLL